jgi:hypothetical protein
MAAEAVPEIVPARAKTGLQSQQQPRRSIEEVIEVRGFAGKNDDGRNADRRLADRRLQPLGHLTLSTGTLIGVPLVYRNASSAFPSVYRNGLTGVLTSTRFHPSLDR